jgi:hypothetical protein
MSRFTYATSAILALTGTATAVYGVLAGECKPFGAGLVLILGASVFAVLYLGTRRKQKPAPAAEGRENYNISSGI